MTPPRASMALLAVTVLILLSPVAAPSQPPWSVTIVLKESAGLERQAEPVTFGVPLPEALGVKEANALALTDAGGRALPAQLDVMARWGGRPDDPSRPIKWLLVDVQGDAAAGRGGLVRLGPGRAASAASRVTAEERGGGVDVAIGRLAFRVGTTPGRLFDWMTLDGRDMIRRDEANGAVLTVAPVTMVARRAPRGSGDLAVSGTHGLGAGVSIAISDTLTGTVAAPGEGYGFGDKYPRQNQQGGRFLRMNPTPQGDRVVPGMALVVARGLPQEETLVVAQAEPDRSLVRLTAPLRFDHRPGEPILLTRSETRVVAQVTGAHRLSLDAPLQRDHVMGELVAAVDRQAPAMVFRAHADQVVVEEAGPLRATLRARGRFEGAGGPLLGGAVEFTARITAFAGREQLRLTFTLENNGPYGYYADAAGEQGDIATWLHLRNLTLEFPLAAAGGVLMAGGLSDAVPAENGLTLTQLRRRTGKPEPENFFYRVRAGEQQSDHQGRLAGWIHTAAGGHGVTVVLRDLWQNYPKSLGVERGRLSVGLWPEGSYFPDFPPGDASAKSHGYYAFEGGRHKTHEIQLRFHERPGDRASAQSFARSVTAPLTPVVPAAWVADSGALGMMAPADLKFADGEQAEALARYEKFQLARVSLQDAEQPRVTIESMRERQAPARGYPEGYYGWMNFGDLAYGETYSSLHYDWPYGMLLQFLRTGDARLFELGRQMTLHRIDIDQVHGGRGHAGPRGQAVRGLARYEKDGHGYGEPLPKTSHTWGGGIVLYYLLTGDRRAWDAATELGDTLRARWRWVLREHTRGDFNEIRHQGWSILNLVHLYRVTHDRADLDIAAALFRNSLLYLEQQAGGKGFWGDYDQPQVQSLNQFGWVIDPLVQLHWETRDPDLLALLQRMAAWVRSGPLAGGETRKGRYQPLHLPWTWKPGAPSGGGYVIRSVFVADLFAYLFLQTRDPEALRWSRWIFRDVAFYFTHAGDFVPPGTRSPTSYTPQRFYQSETKIGAWLAMHPQTYLYVERLLARQGKEPR